MKRAILLLALVVLAAPSLFSQARPRPPLAPADIDAITKLVMLEDTRTFDQEALAALLKSAHPEVRRRAALAIGRIGFPRQRATDAQNAVTTQARALLVTARGDTDVEVAGTVVFSTGQLKDTDAVTWLGERLSAPRRPRPSRAKPRARSARSDRPRRGRSLAKYLADAPVTAAPAVVGEALLASGRFTGPGDLAPIVKWSTAKDDEVRWRATWALFRLRDPAAAEPLLRLSEDASADVRYWAVRGLASMDTTPAEMKTRQSERLRAAMKDPDRRVRTEALRALATYQDDASFDVVLAALESPDTWLSVSAAEAMGRYPARKDTIVPKLVAAAGPTRPTALRLTALTPLVSLAPDAARDVATSLRDSTSQVARTTADRTLQRLAAAADPNATPGARGGGAPAGAGRGPRPDPPRLTEAEYRRIVERWVVTDYNGAPRPHAIWTTPKGEIELELYPGDAPLAVEYFLHEVESGDIVGTEFGRVVPNFVAQQDGIRNAITQRDEVNRHGLTGGNLSWASAGLDTGRPGYTLGSTPQPHNEGDFTALGRVVRGMDVVDRLELGDAVTAARMKR